MEKTANQYPNKRFGGPRKTGRNEQRDKQAFHVKRERPANQQLVCGMRPVMEALDAGKQIDKIMIQANLEGPLAQELKAKVRAAGLPMQFVPIEKLNSMTDSNHQGVVALIAPIAFHSFMELLPTLMEEGRTPMVLLLDHITDVRNLGAIVRTAECAGVDAVVVPDRGSAQIGEDAIKTSSGALLRVPICREANLKTVLNLARQSGMQVCAATEKGATDYLEVDFCQPTLLIMGSEDTGVSPELLKLADVRAKLPIRGEVQSLNVSVAAAIFMYEVLRQRRK